MTRRIRRCIRTDRDGQTLAIVAVMMVALLALLAFGIDLGMAYTARAEAQRVADAAALAGASAFLDYTDPLDAAAQAEARDRAEEYAELNFVRNRRVVAEEPEVIVQVIPAEQTVRVRIERSGLPVWFARFLGQEDLRVSAIAAAYAAEAGSSPCIMPFAVPDIWDEQSGDDLNDNRIFNFDNELPYNGPPHRNPNEMWNYDPDAGDEYRVPTDLRDWDGNLIQPGVGDLLATGYGTNWRHQVGSANEQDGGLRVLLKPQQMGQQNQLENWWQFWKPEGNSNSYNDIRSMILSGECYDITDLTGVGGNIEPVPGDRAVVYKDIVDFIDANDPELRWDPSENKPYFPGDPERSIWESRRIVSVPLVHPNVLLRDPSDSSPLAIVDIATLFIEDPRLPPPHGYNGKPNVDNSVAITGRLVHRGSGAIGPNAGKNEKVLRLIE